MLARGLEGVATVAGRQGQPTRAARLLGAAQALREAVSTPHTLVERSAHERDLADARAQLDEMTWSKAWIDGQEMSLEEAISKALGQDSEPARQIVSPDR